MAMELITDITLELTGDERLYMASAKQGDKRTRFIRIALTNNGKVFTIPTGYIAIANIKKPDKHFCYNECKVTDNKVMVELTNQALAAAGTAHCDIEIRDAQNVYVLSSQAFTIEIEETNRNDAAIESCNEITALENKVQRYIDNIVQTKQDILSVEAAMKVAEAARASAEVDRINAEARRNKSEKDGKQRKRQDNSSFRSCRKRQGRRTMLLLQRIQQQEKQTRQRHALKKHTSHRKNCKKCMKRCWTSREQSEARLTAAQRSALIR
ncbi:MAG: BppU family phage baseplate upper protein [Lachnospiraceae bacterium]